MLWPPCQKTRKLVSSILVLLTVFKVKMPNNGNLEVKKVARETHDVAFS